MRWLAPVLAALALLAGAGAAAGALSLAAGERTGQRAMLRCAGVTPWRLAAWELLEGAALGAVASIVGLLAGLALEHVLVAALVAPAGAPVVGPRTLLLAPAAGLVAATLAAAAREDGCAVLVASRDAGLAAQADRTVALAAGRVVPRSRAAAAVGT